MLWLGTGASSWRPTRDSPVPPNIFRNAEDRQRFWGWVEQLGQVSSWTCINQLMTALRGTH